VFYSDDRQLLNHLSRFIAAALNAGNGAVVVATRGHQESLVQSLEASGVDVAAALKQGRYIVVDAADALSSCMANGMFVSTDFSKASKISCSQRQVLSRESILASHFLENVWTFCGSKVTQRLRSRRKNSATNLPRDTLWIFFADIQWEFRPIWKKKPSRESAQSIRSFIVSKKPSIKLLPVIFSSI